MKLYIVKRKGANWWGNLLLDCSMTFGDGEKVYYDKCFHRKRQATKYLDTFDYKKYFEIATLEFKTNKKLKTKCVCKGGATGRTVTGDFENQICDTCGNIVKN